MNVRLAGIFKKKKETTSLKTGINFIGVEEDKSAVSTILPIVITLVVAAILFSKFAVIDRYHRLWEKEAENRALAAELEKDNAALNKAKSLTERFYHFTWTQMDDEEVGRMSRVRVADLVTYITSQMAGVRSYTVSGDVLNVQVMADSLQSISRVAGELGKRKIVEGVTVQTARTGSFEEADSGIVEAQLVIYIRTQDELSEMKKQEAN